MKVLVTGIKGQLGYDVVKELEKNEIEAIGVDVDEMDLTNSEQVSSVMQEKKPDAVIHCAAYTAVDKAEDDRELCKKVNVCGTSAIAKECKALDIKMLYISTDYVFPGDGEKPWEPDMPKAPMNFYGQTKFDGEEEVKKYLDKYFIVRISWVFGENGKNFVDTMLRLGKERGAVSVVDDQIGSPTYTKDLAVLLVDMIQSERYGDYNASNEGFCSWCDFAKEIFKVANLEVEVTPVTSNEFPTKAKRPKNSRMSKEKLVENGFKKLPTWQDAVKRYLAECAQQV